MSDSSAETSPRLSTGIDGLDDVLEGGFPAGGGYLLEGEPGAGKTTLALQFLLSGAERGERCAFISMSESEAELRQAAASHGWNLDGIRIVDLSENQGGDFDSGDYSVFTPEEIELRSTIARVTEAVESFAPGRLVIDPITGIKARAGSVVRYRQQVLHLKAFLRERGVTALFLNIGRHDEMDELVATAMRGIITMRLETGEFGMTRRYLTVRKLRGAIYQEGEHPLRIRTGGLEVFPRLGAVLPARSGSDELLATGIEGLDGLLGGGIERGTVTVVAGQSGAGKTTVAMQFLMRGEMNGERVHVISLDESAGSIRRRIEQLGMVPPGFEGDGKVVLERIRSTEVYPAEFSTMVTRAVDEEGVSLMLIDSLTGYKAGVTGERHLVHHLSQLLDYLKSKGVTTLLTLEHTEQAPLAVKDPFGMSYLADNLILMRFFEAAGHVRRAISVLKKRQGAHESAIREIRFTDRGIVIGSPLSQFRGVLGGTPEYVGDEVSLMDGSDANDGPR